MPVLFLWQTLEKDCYTVLSVNVFYIIIYYNHILVSEWHNGYTAIPALGSQEMDVPFS